MFIVVLALNSAIVGVVLWVSPDNRLTSLHNGKNKLSIKRPSRTVTNAGKGGEKLELSYTAGGNAKWGSHCGKQSGSPSKN